MKLKVVPPVHISTGNNVVAAGTGGNMQMFARNSGIGKEMDASAVDGDHTEKSSIHVEGRSYDEVKSVKSPPRRKKTNSADSTENQPVMMPFR